MQHLLDFLVAFAQHLDVFFQLLGDRIVRIAVDKVTVLVFGAVGVA